MAWRRQVGHSRSSLKSCSGCFPERLARSKLFRPRLLLRLKLTARKRKNDKRGISSKKHGRVELQTCIDMLCILKAVIAWIILIFAGGGLASRLCALLSPFPGASTDPKVEEALRSMRRSFKRAHILRNIFRILLILGYLFALYHFWGVGLAASGLLILIACALRPLWTSPSSVSFVADVILWGSSILVWYSLCK
jgi:hypothetical protein